MENKMDGRGKGQHSLDLLDKMRTMRDSAELVDVVLVAEGARFPCHRLVLAACSPYFRAMFTCGLLECRQREVALHEVAAEGVAALLTYMYSGALEVTAANVQALALAARFLQMEGALGACLRFLETHMDASNCLGVRRLAQQVGAEDLGARARRFLCLHFAEVALHEEVLDAEAPQLLELVQSDDLNVSREDSVLDLVLRWARRSPGARAGHLAALLGRVRLGLVDAAALRRALGRHAALLGEAGCAHLLHDALAAAAPPPGRPALRYGMETTSLLLCVGNDAAGIRSRRRSYGDASFCYDPVARKTYFISSPKYGEGLGTVCAGVVTEDNTLVVAGEASAARLSRQRNRNVEIYRYHERGNRFWEKLCTTEFRELYALGSVHNDLYVVGGQMKAKSRYLVTNCVDRYSMEQGSWRRVAPLPVPLACHAVVTVNELLYVVGGWTPQVDRPDDEPDRLSNQLWQYDPSRDLWRERAPMRYSRYRFSSAVVHGEIYVLGGIGCVGRDRGQIRKCLDVVEIYSPDGDFWREGPPMPSPLLSLRTNSSSAGTVDGKLYVCGGFHGADRHEVISKEILELDPWESQWNVVAIDVLMHDSYDVCLVARMNPRDLIPPPADLVD